MKVTCITLFANDEETIKFDLHATVSKSQYVIRNIIGIDAEELIPKFYGFSVDGSTRFYDFKLKPREIVMRVALNPRYHLNEDVSSIRDEIYRIISATRSGELKIQFQSGAATIAETYGHIVKMEVGHFSQIPEVQVTIRCNDPMLRGINPVVYSDTALPTANPIVIADNSSTAPHGFDMQLTFTNAVTNFAIQDQNPDPEWTFEIVPATSFLSGDVLHFSSEFNHKELYMVRSGVTTHLMDKIEPNSRWPIIFPGFNQLYFWNIGEIDLDEIRFTPAYWGV